MKKKHFIRYAFLTAMLLLSSLLFPDNLDSLKLVVRNVKSDTSGVLKIIKFSQKVCGNSPDEALKALREAEKIAQLIQYKYGIARTFMVMGLAYKNKSLFDSAENYYGRALNLLLKLDRKKDISVVYNNFGVVEKERGNFAKALDYYVKALQLIDEKKDPKAVGRTYSNIGIIYRNMKNFDKALEYQWKALRCDSISKDKNSKGRTFSNIANIFLEKKLYRQSIDYFLNALNIFRETDDKQSLAIVLGNLSSAYMNNNDLKNATKYADEALHASESLNDVYTKAQCYILLGELNAKQGFYDASEKNYNAAADLYKKIGSPQKLKDIYLGLASLYKQSKQFEKSVNSYEKYSSLKDSLFNSDFSKQISEMEQKYSSGQKQKEIELLKQTDSIKDLELKKKNITIFAGFISGLILLFLILMIYRNLRQKKKTNLLLEKQNEEISLQKLIIEEKNKDIIDSINYAQRLQENILPHEEVIRKTLPESFVLYLPKDIVSGDFYWMESVGGDVYFASVDCTGHGVPGAIMSIVGHNLLRKILIEEKISSCAKMLDSLVINLVKYLRQDASSEKISNDGMDITLCKINRKTMQLQYASAFNPFVIIKEKELTEYKADKFSIGRHTFNAGNKFNETTISLEKGDMIYLFSDGYADQFGGVKGKKMMRRNFYTLLKEISGLGPEQQKKQLKKTFSEWKQEMTQVDDVMVIGIRI